MTDLLVTTVADAWVNGQSSPERRGNNYGDTDGVHISAGGTTRRGFVKPELPNIAGRVVLDAYIVGHGAESLAAQTVTVAAVADRWQEGRIDYNNQPAIVSGSGVATAISATAADVPVTFTGLAAMVQAVADGSDWHGVRLTTTATSAQKFRSSESGKPAWEFHVVLSDVPDAPSGPRPDGGAVEATSPIVSWDPVDEQVLSRVQVDTPTGGADPDEVSPDYDSGWQSNGDPSWSLVTRRTLVGVGPHYFRVQIEDAGGNESDWSDWAEFTVAAMPSLVVDSPTGAFGDPSPTVAAHLSSGTVRAWDVMVTGSSRADVRYYSEVKTATTVSQLVPETVKGKKVLREDEAGEIRLRVWPAGSWATAIGQLPYRQVWIPATFDDDLALAPVTNLSVDRYDVGDPRNIWTWEDAEAADAYLLQVDGITVRRVELDDLTVSGGRYEFTDGGEIVPHRPHTLAVRRVEGDQRSEPAELEDWSHEVHGVWLLPEGDIDPMVFDGTVIGGWTATDAVATYVTLEGEQVDVIYGTPGRADNFEGEVWSGHDVWGTLDRLKELRKSKTRRARMVWPGESVMVRVRSPHATAADEFRPGNLLHKVRFGFVEVT